MDCSVESKIHNGNQSIAICIGPYSSSATDSGVVTSGFTKSQTL